MKTYTEVTSGTQTVTVASHGDPRDDGSFEPSHECVACGLQFKQSEMRFFRGKAYGIPCGCHTDIRSLLRRERKEVPSIENPKRRVY